MWPTRNYHNRLVTWPLAEALNSFIFALEGKKGKKCWGIASSFSTVISLTSESVFLRTRSRKRKQILFHQCFPEFLPPHTHLFFQYVVSCCFLFKTWPNPIQNMATLTFSLLLGKSDNTFPRFCSFLIGKCVFISVFTLC